VVTSIDTTKNKNGAELNWRWKRRLSLKLIFQSKNIGALEVIRSYPVHDQK
jgi:hypothetical protein